MPTHPSTPPPLHPPTPALHPSVRIRPSHFRADRSETALRASCAAIGPNLSIHPRQSVRMRPRPCYAVGPNLSTHPQSIGPNTSLRLFCADRSEPALRASIIGPNPPSPLRPSVRSCPPSGSQGRIRTNRRPGVGGFGPMAEGVGGLADSDRSPHNRRGDAFGPIGAQGRGQVRTDRRGCGGRFGPIAGTGRGQVGTDRRRGGADTDRSPHNGAGRVWTDRRKGVGR
jgi:hypothetical protein